MRCHGGSSTARSISPLTDSDLVSSLFQDVLGRPANIADVSSWIDRLQNGLSRADLVATILASPKLASAVICPGSAKPIWMCCTVPPAIAK